MPNMESCTGRVRKHIQHIEFRSGFIYFCFVSGIVFPILLPLALDILVIVFHIYLCV